MLVLLLPLDWVKVSTELGKSIKLDSSHLLLAIQDVVRHAVNVIGLFLVIPKCDHSSPSQVLEVPFYVLITLWLNFRSLTTLVLVL